MHRTAPILLALTAALVASPLAPLAAADDTRPNVVFIMTDDLAAWAIGAGGHPNARTPNMNRLCREGARLANCFVATPVCSASRAALLTSRYPTETGIVDYLDPARQPDVGLAPSYATWPRALAEAGYATALVGKWHLGVADRFHPTRFGYGEFSGFRVGGFTSKDPTVEVDGRDRKIEGWTPDILTDFAIDFIRRKREWPFCLSLHYWAPHANTQQTTPDGDRTWLPLSEADFGPMRDLKPAIPNPHFPKLDVPRVERMTREYLGSISSVDRNLGRLLDALDRWQLADRTLVIFTSDHGYNLGHHGIWHKGNGRWILTDNRGPRPNLWDNSLRSPAILRWPGHIRPNVLVRQTVTFLDWFPTIVAAAGAERPTGATLRGRNILPLLEDPTIPWDDNLFAQYRMWQWNQTGADLRTYRTTDWKLVRDFRHEGKDELYHLAVDPQERENLVDSQDSKVLAARAELDAKLREAMRRIGDPALVGPAQQNRE